VEAKKEVRKQIVRELHIMRECNSPFIVSFYGAFLNEAGDVIMCMEYMDCGYLHLAACTVVEPNINFVSSLGR
jgi:mitogen-activated protein kinase kinase